MSFTSTKNMAKLSVFATKGKYVPTVNKNPVKKVVPLAKKTTMVKKVNNRMTDYLNKKKV